GQSFVVLRQAGEAGQLYGSVTNRDIAEVASTTGVPVDRNQVLLDAPIKTVGLYDVKIALHPEVVVSVKINVARTADEAEAQAQGAVLTGPVSDRAEARAAAQALLEEETPEGEEDQQV
ncbi:MAG TPA: 50S ribosomal L9 C-terminal domain-containing protein, partial [Aestuariivirgaceae bacterium]|nr:50S ribosomal L9 C-terminal domain-containing protein [Aestuariivirgaceae bacterium]